MTSYNNNLRIGMVGGSISGCTAAIEMSRAGHKATIVQLERALEVLRRHGWYLAVEYGLLPGKERFLDYLYLDADDRRSLAWLRDRGIRLFAQDVPTSRPVELVELLAAHGNGGDE